MDFVASTITEHYEQQGWIRGRQEGKLEGKLEGAVDMLKTLYNQGVLSKEQFDKRIVESRQDGQIRTKGNKLC